MVCAFLSCFYSSSFFFKNKAERKFSFLLHSFSGHGIFSLRRPNCMEQFYRLLSCALEENCMSTPEATLMCKFTDDPFNDYADCHRYDQSITNLLLANLLGYNSKRWSSEVTNFFEIRRYESDDSMKPYECLLNISSNK
ncbi:Protein CBG04378 [Trichuris trichiura]|uniref:Protein CBG04378 n=1 Tax=Trichuris trichiura TaxID=36087 RepID=A0A077ZFS7_TRITR|nr:Protein CBG04378 [Trichuris trichiura]